MVPNIVKNTDVKEKDATCAVVVAVSSSAIFDLDTNDVNLHNEPLKRGPAFPFVKAVQAVNESLLVKNPDETLLFDMILLSNESQEIHSRIISSTNHYGLDIGRFCFCKKEDSIESLQSNNVTIFLSSNTNDVHNALQKGVPAALLNQQAGNQDSNQLKVLFSGDVLGFSEDTVHRLREEGICEAQLHNIAAAKGSLKDFATLMGKMRKRFGLEDSPLSTALLTGWSSRNVCASALKRLQSWGLEVDEAFCLAGAPQSLMLAQLKPHILCFDGLHNM